MARVDTREDVMSAYFDLARQHLRRGNLCGVESTLETFLFRSIGVWKEEDRLDPDERK